jgi:hypothetical protein
MVLKTVGKSGQVSFVGSVVGATVSHVLSCARSIPCYVSSRRHQVRKLKTRSSATLRVSHVLSFSNPSQVADCVVASISIYVVYHKRLSGFIDKRLCYKLMDASYAELTVAPKSQCEVSVSRPVLAEGAPFDCLIRSSVSSYPIFTAHAAY